jgi:hypothetical protein
MKHPEGKLSYAVTFQLHPEYKAEGTDFLKRLGSAVEQHLAADPELLFVDAEDAGEMAPCIQVNLLVGNREDAQLRLKAFVDGAFRFLQGSRDVDRVADSKGHVLYARRARRT